MQSKHTVTNIAWSCNIVYYMMLHIRDKVVLLMTDDIEPRDKYQQYLANFEVELDLEYAKEWYSALLLLT